jgi:hypothetical protein
MSFVEEGVTGAFRATWRKGNPRSLLRTIMDNNPTADEARIHQLFWQEIEDDKDLLRACVEYWLDNNYRSLTSEIRPSSPRPRTSAASSRPPAADIKIIKDQVKKRVELEARTVLLDWLMPNEKPLRECTGADCASMGGWLAQLAKKVPVKKTVGAILSEKEVAAIFKAATK